MRNPADGFWVQVDRTTNGCWEWTGGRTRKKPAFSYGYWRGKLAHRVAWELARGPIPDGMYVCHHCDNPPCVRPDHLFLGTPADNIHDMQSKGRGLKKSPLCKSGRHPMDGENVNLVRRGKYLHRHCKECNRENMRRYRQRKRGAAA